jgi:hypothetical protein
MMKKTGNGENDPAGDSDYEIPSKLKMNEFLNHSQNGFVYRFIQDFANFHKINKEHRVCFWSIIQINRNTVLLICPKLPLTIFRVVYHLYKDIFLFLFLSNYLADEPDRNKEENE